MHVDTRSRVVAEVYAIIEAHKEGIGITGTPVSIYPIQSHSKCQCQSHFSDNRSSLAYISGKINEMVR
jgi:hypothetical protein